VVAPLLDLLRYGTTPRRLAWSIAAGIVLGVNPLLGSTTLVTLAAAAIFRLNLIASQIATHLCYPLQIALFFAFIRMGDKVFHTGRLPLHHKALFYAVRHHPLATTRLLWKWEWHALISWALVSLVLTPLLVTILTPILTRLDQRFHHHPQHAGPDPAKAG
jgi:uncharacterized protein (DUF2062 family)